MKRKELAELTDEEWVQEAKISKPCNLCDAAPRMAVTAIRK